MASIADDHQGMPVPRRHFAIAATTLGTVLVTVDAGMVNVALPTLSRDLHVEPSAAVLIVTVYQLVMIMAVLPMSAIGDRIGHRRLFLMGLTLYVCATFFCFFARSLPFLVLVRGFQAVGAAAALSVSSAMVRAIYPRHQLGRGLGINSVAASSAAVLAPTLGGLILGIAPWPFLFAVVIPFGLAAILLGRKALPEPDTHEEPFDVLAAVLCASTFGVGVAGLESAVHGDSPVISVALVVLAAVIGTIFVRRELSQSRPVLPVDLLGQRELALTSTGLFAASLAIMCLMLTLPFRLQQSYGFSPAEAGLMLAPWSMVMMGVAPLAGVLSDRIAPGYIGAVGAVIGVAGLAALSLLPEHPSAFDVMWRVAICGVGFGAFMSPNARHIIGAAPMERAAAAGALSQTTRMLGQVLGATLCSALLAMGVGAGSVPPLIAAGLLLIAGLFGLMAVGRPWRRPAPEELPDL
ncbi:MAG TPA: MFS transporter [Novosphingobium sp.]